MAEEGLIDVLWKGGSCCMLGGVGSIPRLRMECVTAREMTMGWVDEYQTQDKDVEWVEGWWGKETDVGWVKGWWA